MEVDKIPMVMLETKMFLDTLLSKERLKNQKRLGLSNKEFRLMLENGINTLVIQARDKMIMAAFIESKGLINELMEYSDNVVSKMKEEYSDGDE